MPGAVSVGLLVRVMDRPFCDGEREGVPKSPLQLPTAVLAPVAVLALGLRTRELALGAESCCTALVPALLSW